MADHRRTRLLATRRPGAGSHRNRFSMFGSGDTPNRRKGLLLLDLVLGTAATAVIIGGTLVVLARVQRQREVSRQYFLATQLLANVAESIDAAPVGQEADVSLPSDATNGLRDPSLSIDVQPAATLRDDGDRVPDSTRQIRCTIRWGAGAARTTSLTIWKHRRSESEIGQRGQPTESTATDNGALP